MVLNDKEQREVRRKAVQIRGAVHMFMTAVNDGQFIEAEYQAAAIQKLATEIVYTFTNSEI